MMAYNIPRIAIAMGSSGLVNNAEHGCRCCVSLLEHEKKKGGARNAKRKDGQSWGFVVMKGSRHHLSTTDEQET